MSITQTRDEVELPVYTSIFRLQRRLYRVYDVELPVPVTFPQVAAFLMAAFFDVLLLRAVGVELTPASAWAFLVPPAVAAWVANRRIADERSPLEWGVAQLRHLAEPRTLTGLAPAHEPDSLSFTVAVWRPRTKVSRSVAHTSRRAGHTRDKTRKGPGSTRKEEDR
ncbi:MAG: TcpE family conjugal transfer membrane protein [Acidimicrobiales bacterium]